ncbi:Ig-like domain-containing protein [Paremcibacter congregatus]|uniref:Cadherin-like domain-containing protein n=1 Tax=Paremcibacter congregatus TaxID=2043170 RepID=A0A2G4YV92_9PROT|nr:cadherin-like domain-containing protein [Paremcibacter congregatus]PHZ86274.1 hypothetical protein CRD36_06305 [Paremcibacter congregatus]QDE27241.1 hypothetical protein FIV45_08070 [Paremcibacter congregatus]
MLQSVQTIHRDSEKNNTTLEKNTSHPKKITRASTIVLALLPLSACGGGGSSPTTTAPPVAPPATPDFTEDPTNVFVARDDSARTLDKGTATANLTVTGKAGDDSITTGSGADIIIGAGGGDTISSGAGVDFIRGGEGLDTIDAGSGDDVIVVVGTTSADQYDGNDITNPAGSGMDLSSLLSLADLNGRTVSEVVSGETIDGGGGNNTLYIYGTVDLTGVTLTNLTQLVVNSDVTLTQAQINQFTTIKGDGSSVLNITVPDGADGVVLDFSNVDLTGIGEINVSGNITITISSLADLEGVGNFITSGGASFNLAFIAGETPTEISLQEISDMFAGVTSINLGDHVTLKVDAPELLAELGITSISGNGSLQADDTIEARTALDNIVLEVGAIYAQTDNFTTAEDTQIYLSISDDILGNDSSLYGSDVTFNNISLSGSSTENATVRIDYDLGVVIITPNENYTGALELTYNISDFEGNQTSGDVSVDVASVDDPATAYGATAIVSIGETRKLSIDGIVEIGGIIIDRDGDQLHIQDVDSDLSSLVIHVVSTTHGSV